MTGTAAPLAGITVVDFSELLPGPFFTQSLAEMGARVLKVERPPTGDNTRHLGPGVFEAVNRGKTSLLVDLKDPAQRDTVMRHIADADVVVEAYRPGVMQRLGLDARTLLAAHPRLVYVSLSGYGQHGPWAQLPGHDINYLAAAGVLAVSGQPGDGQPPAQGFGLPAADLCGTMYALSATLAALLQRTHTGRGQHLDVSLADCALHWMTPRLGAWREAGADTLAAQRESALCKPAYGAFRCRDGRHLTIAALEDHFWRKLCEVLDLGAFADPAYVGAGARKKVAAAINETIERCTATEDSTALLARLQAHDVPVAPVVLPSELGAQLHFRQRGCFAADDGAALPLPRFPVPLAGMQPDVLGPAPALDSARA